MSFYVLFRFCFECDTAFPQLTELCYNQSGKTLFRTGIDHFFLLQEERKVGKYLNPGNEAFAEIARSNYIDKTAMIELINRTIGTNTKLTCVSRPRRFGKSYAAQMLCAYYDCSCDSHDLFRNMDISLKPDFEKHLNKYQVIYLDISGFLSDLNREHLAVSDVTVRIMDEIRSDIVQDYPELEKMRDVSDCILACAQKTGRQFVFIIDEWDAVIREAAGDRVTQKAFLNLLRSWFKNGNFTPKAVAAAYMTGILPIKKDGSQSAISDFIEYPILYPGDFAPYTGFTESEVISLCDREDIDYEELRSWYDGYEFPECGPVYNPFSVMRAVHNKKCRSYWQKTSAAESLLTYINMDFDGLQEVVARLIAGEEIEVNTDSFENDLETFKNKDDVLTLLIHLGYLTYHENEGTVRIPNEEIRIEFRQILGSRDVGNRWIRLIRNSEKLLADTIAGDEAAVARAITKVRDMEYAPTFYNDEQALRYVIKFAYIAAIDKYMKVEELPSGHGIADVVYIPRQRTLMPALLVELKWNRSAEGAIKQIRDRNYPAVFQNYGGEVLLVGINYDPVKKEHSCKIERIPEDRNSKKKKL